MLAHWSVDCASDDILYAGSILCTSGGTIGLAIIIRYRRTNPCFQPLVHPELVDMREYMQAIDDERQEAQRERERTAGVDREVRKGFARFVYKPNKPTARKGDGRGTEDDSKVDEEDGVEMVELGGNGKGNGGGGGGGGGDGDGDGGDDGGGDGGGGGSSGEAGGEQGSGAQPPSAASAAAAARAIAMGEEDTEFMCSICLAEYEPNDQMCELPCKHQVETARCSYVLYFPHRTHHNDHTP